MAAPPKITTPAQCLKFRFVHELGSGVFASSSIYFLFTGGRPSVSDCGTLATDAATAWNSHMAAMLSTGSLLGTVYCQDVTDTSGAESLWSGSHAGTRAGSQPTMGTCTNIAYKINQHYRGGKPKGFWPFGITTDSTDNTNWSGTFQSSLNTAFAAFIAAIVGASSGTTVVGAHQAVSFYKGATANTDLSMWAPRNMPAPRSTAVLYPVQSYQLTAKFGSQRRRLS